MNPLPTPTRPEACAIDSVYSNADHSLSVSVVHQLRSNPNLYAGHPAWNFMGYIWFSDGEWHEEVWIHGGPVATHSREDLSELIEFVNDTYGHR